MIKKRPRIQELRKELERIISKIDKTDIKKIILFGSLATGHVGLVSDIDLIIVKDTKERFLDRLESIYNEMEPNKAVDVLVYTPQEFNNMSAWNSFLKKAVREGRTLYEA